jgi:RNA polymerase sigma-70 factor (ECF subfamily)
MKDVKADETAIRRVLQGDSTAFEHLADRHCRLVYAICLARLGHVEAAEDLTQEVFLRAFLNLSKLQNAAAFRPWVARMARNLGANWVRSNVRASRLLPMVDLEDAAVEAIPENDPSPHEELLVKERNALLQDAIMQLKPEEREAVMLHYMEGLTKKEIAEHLGLHPSTVGRSLERSLGLLRGNLEASIRGAAESMTPSPRLARQTKRCVVAAALLTGSAREALAGAAAVAAPTGSAHAGGSSAGILGLLWEKAQALLAASRGMRALLAVSTISAVGAGTIVFHRIANANERLIPSETSIELAANQGDKASIVIPTIYDGSIRGWRVRLFNQVQRNGQWVDEGLRMTTRVDVMEANPTTGVKALFTIEKFRLPRDHADHALSDVMTGYQFQAEATPRGSFHRTRPVIATPITPEMSKYIGHSLQADVTPVIAVAEWTIGDDKLDAIQLELPGFADARMNVETTTSYRGRALADGKEVLLIHSQYRGNLESSFVMTTIQAMGAPVDLAVDRFEVVGTTTYFLDPNSHRITAADHTTTASNIMSRLVRHRTGEEPLEQAMSVPDKHTREVIRVEYF